MAVAKFDGTQSVRQLRNAGSFFQPKFFRATGTSPDAESCLQRAVESTRTSSFSTNGIMKKQAKTTGSTKSATNQKQPETQISQDVSTELAAAQNAVELLKADHRKVEGLFQEFEAASESEQKEKLAHQICTELMVHTKLEEEIFYRACREKGVDSDTLDEAQVEHDGAKILITELLTLDPESEFYGAKVKVLSEYIKHHVAEEEKKNDGIFARAQESDMDLDALGQQLQQRKQELMQRAEAGRMRLPQPVSLFSLMDQSRNQEMQGMPRMGGRERDEYGRFMSDEDDYRSGNGGRGRSSSNYLERDDQGRFMSNDDRGYSSRSRSGSDYRERDDQGRFMSDNDGYSSRGRSSSGYRERDDQGRFMSEDDRYSSRSSRSRNENEDDDRRHASRGRGHGGWFGDSEGHAQAAQRGWEERGHSRSSRYQEDDDDRRYSSRSGGRDQGHGGWFGDREGHSEAAQRGWEHRGSPRSQRYDDDNRRYSSRSSGGGGGRGEGQGHGGWFGDPRGHSQAARRGWENRD